MTLKVVWLFVFDVPCEYAQNPDKPVILILAKLSLDNKSDLFELNGEFLEIFITKKIGLLIQTYCVIELFFG